uniref:Major facilitator superfamily (MFS) profile domain-containing protein n=1 Tax=Kwoniella bestiolae CBS 10118 TaxID=1296100 RepID=A0A1B9G4Q4_9TREE|nr:hypothetical protein I302_03696 [Kwoniella bestiolae CBS 10118]OCF26019.1 hypothetical protein I302_03696 [Kwoniella bestiolae CBS 10118]
MATTIGENVGAGLTLARSNSSGRQQHLEPTTFVNPTGKSTRGPWQKFVSWIWDPDYYEKSDAERKLVFKLDCALLSLLCFGWLMKYIDQTNLANAYVSGLKEDLHIEGNQYTWMQTIYNVVICVMQIPSNMIVLKVRPSWWLSMCEIGWAIFTFAQAGAQNYQQMYAFRFFVALFEAAFQPVAYFILGSWYTKSELAKRASIFYVSGPIGQAFSGFLQAAIYKNMDGLQGLAGWRWLYLICIMTIPCGIAIFFFLPDFPDNCNSWFITEEEKELAKARCAKNGTIAMSDALNFRTFKRVIVTWHFWLLIPTYVLYAYGIQNYNYFGIYLKAAGYSVSMRNILPSCANLVGIIPQLVWGWCSDRFRSRYAWCLIPCLWGLCPTVILAVYPDSNTLKVFAFMVTGTYFVTHIWWSWVNEICHGSMEERAFIIASINCAFYACNAWLPTIIFLQTEAPTFPKGYPTVLACNCGGMIGFTIIWFMHKRQLRREEAAMVGTVEEAGVPMEQIDEKPADDKDATRVAVLKA